MSNDVIKAHLHSALALLDGGDIVKDHLTSSFAAESARADAAERMVCELRGIVADVATWDPLMPGEARVIESVRAALASTADIAGRWVPAAERDAAVARAEKAEAAADWNARACEDNQQLIATAERARDEVGIQFAAAQAEIARMRPVVEAARRVEKSIEDLGGRHVEAWSPVPFLRTLRGLHDALRALDTVPGDALAPKITAAVDALGIDTSNVKGGG